jgi:hypothetical protein
VVVTVVVMLLLLLPPPPLLLSLVQLLQLHWMALLPAAPQTATLRPYS